ncbi:MAG: folate-binding protein YgfZ [Polaromonas sp.]|nr:folate-binding protein YgfZ [Polaromonas sp.]
MNFSLQAAEISGTVQLKNHGVIRATGADADQFLQGQLTQDVTRLDSAQASLAAFCNAKGRMQASFVVFRSSADDLLLICSRDLIAATVKRLSMFVMRAKVTLLDASDEFVLYGAAGSAVQSLAGCSGAPWTKVDLTGAALVFLYPGAGRQRALWCAPAGSAAPGGPALELETWNWLEVQSGVALVTQPIFEAFVPQMLNYESVDGVNFKKGCYPGQEIVARSQFRGTLKRRAYLVHSGSNAGLGVGQAVFHAQEADQPCGMVAASAANPAGGFDAIVSLQTAAAADALAHPGAARLMAGHVHGPTLALLPLPYLLREDI